MNINTDRKRSFRMLLILLRINKFLEISPSTAIQARAVTGRLLCLQRCYISR